MDTMKILEECDADMNGLIEYTEFITASINWKNYLSSEKLKSAFNNFDLDNNGYIDR